jgi:predicted RNA-binding Zn-ribbon protein involved in translation (DUF1610 family)
VERPWKLILQVVVAIAAIAAISWLGNVLFDDGSWNPELADRYDQDTWISWTLIGLAVLLVIEILLLKPSYKTVLRSVGLVEFEIQARQEEAARETASDADYRYMVGCSGCGTVFDRRGTELGEDAFACPNCGRGGVLRDRELHKAVVTDRSCVKCGNGFQAYHDRAECPVCHALNA